ncbi:MAG: folylpolyglutamate synthase/dihydrofolate synthase family protein [Cyclobacteriaceae bacterium]
MTYQEVLDYLYSQLPMYQKQGKTAFKKDLSNTLALCELLDNPQDAIKTVHIAGTNGKGSTAHSLASVLKEAGYKTGLYTSPHLKDYRDRIRVNGDMIPEEAVITFVEHIRSAINDIQPSFFELTVAMALDYFRKQEVAIAIIETGLGGRLDSTNVITPLISVITSIGLDHMDLLGDTLEAIAGEKAGIIKPGIPVVLPKELPGDTKSIFLRHASEKNSSVNTRAEQYSCTPTAQGVTVYRQKDQLLEKLTPGIRGIYFLRNLPTVLEAIEELRLAGFSISEANVIDGIEKISTNTGLKGRWQKLGDNPLMITDVGHNTDGWKDILAHMATIEFRQLHIVLGMVADKEADTIFDLLPSDAIYYLCEPNIPRAMPVRKLAEHARKAGFTYTTVGDVNECIDLARQNAGKDDFIFIGGSTFVVAEIKDL